MVLASAGDDSPLDKLAALADKIYEVTATPPQTPSTFSPPICKVTASDQLVTELSYLRDEVSHLKQLLSLQNGSRYQRQTLHISCSMAVLVMSIKSFAGIIRNLVHLQGSANTMHTLFTSHAHTKCTHYHTTGKTLRPVANGEQVSLAYLKVAYFTYTTDHPLSISSSTLVLKSASFHLPFLIVVILKASPFMLLITLPFTHMAPALSPLIWVCAVFLDGFSSSPM